MPRILAVLLLRMGWTGLVLAVPLAPWVLGLVLATTLWRPGQPTMGWVLLGWSLGVLGTVVLPATAAPPAPGARPSLRWRVGGWFVRYLPPPWGFIRATVRKGSARR